MSKVDFFFDGRKIRRKRVHVIAFGSFSREGGVVAPSLQGRRDEIEHFPEATIAMRLSRRALPELQSPPATTGRQTSASPAPQATEPLEEGSRLFEHNSKWISSSATIDWAVGGKRLSE